MDGTIHAGVGIGIARLALGSICPWVAVPLALVSHAILDDLNVGTARWYHGLGDGWRKASYIAFLTLSAGVVGFFLWEFRSWLTLATVIAACLPDFEHPFRYLFHKTDTYWIHAVNVMYPRALRETQWALLARAILAGMIAVLLWRESWGYWPF